MNLHLGSSGWRCPLRVSLFPNISFRAGGSERPSWVSSVGWACWGTRAITYRDVHAGSDFPAEFGVLHPSHDLSMWWSHSRAYWNVSLHHFTRKQTQNKQIFLMVKTASFSQNQKHICFWASARNNSERLTAFEKRRQASGQAPFLSWEAASISGRAIHFESL